MNEPDLRARGRRIVAAIVLATLAISAATIIAFVVMRGTDRLGSQVVRFGLSVFLSVHLYRGAPWARWVAAVLFLIAGGFGLASLPGLDRMHGFAVVALALALIHLASGLALIALPSVRVHFGGRVRLPGPDGGSQRRDDGSMDSWPADGTREEP